VWRGLGAGHGYLRSREVTIRAAGRGAYARPLAVRVLLPGPEGKIAAIPSSVAGPSSVASSGTAAWSGRAPRSSAAVLPVNVVPIQAAG
jgi:hypothetical protein